MALKGKEIEIKRKGKTCSGMTTTTWW